MPGRYCNHCGLPIPAARQADGENLFCCYGCYLVSRLVGRGGGRDGVQAWNLLRLGVGAILSMQVMMISLLLYTGTVEAQAVQLFRWLMLLLASGAMVILGYPFVIGAAREISRGRLSLDSLIAIGSVAAYASSAVNTILGSGQVYFDTATMLPALVTFGKLIEATAKARAGRLVRSLETLLPKETILVEPGGDRVVPLGELKAGDRVRVLPGGRFPADGRIVDGAATVEEAAFTGESRLRYCGPGDPVIAGTVNGPTSVVIAAEAVGEEMLLSRIIEMTEQARQQPARWQRLAERAAEIFTPAVVALAGATIMAWWAWGDPRHGLLAALAVMVTACPCAIGIAAPLAASVAIARAAANGAIIRGGDVLERLGKVNLVFFDKTGTITAGELVIENIEIYGDTTGDNEMLAMLASLEQASEHAVARAVVREARRRGLELGSVSDVQVQPGQGISGRVTCRGATCLVRAGQGLSANGAERLAPQRADDGCTIIDVEWDGTFRGRLRLRDCIRAGAAVAVAELRRMGVETAMLSGDSLAAAGAIAAEVGIGRVKASYMPDKKIDAINSARRKGRVVAMVGDGINDAPALAAAEVGIALGAGTDLARQAGNVVLVADDLRHVPWLISMGRQARRTIRANLLWAASYNGVALAAASAGLLHPLLAALAMVVSSLTVLGNSLRLHGFVAPDVTAGMREARWRATVDTPPDMLGAPARQFSPEPARDPGP